MAMDFNTIFKSYSSFKYLFNTDAPSPNKELNPFLNPFIRKPSVNIPYMYPFKQKPLCELGLFRYTDGAVFVNLLTQLLIRSMITKLKTVTTEKDWPLQAVSNLIVTSNTCLFMALEKPSTDITFQKPKAQYTSIERPTPMEMFLEKPKSSNNYILRPEPTELVFERSIPMISVQRPVPENVSWTRVDLAQERLDKVPLNTKVAMGVLSGMVATIIVHPLDVIKVRLQLFPKQIRTLTMLRRIMMCEGQQGLYAGLTAGLLRQLTYTGSRLYVYNTLYDKYKREHGSLPPLSVRTRIAVEAGMVGAFLGTPSEVALVRMTELRRRRRSPCSPPCAPACKLKPDPGGVLSKLRRLARKEGVGMWWRGGLPTVVRSTFITSAQVFAYAEIREAFVQGGRINAGVRLHVCSAIWSSLISAVLSLPVDQVKTRYQSYQERHTSMIELLEEMLKKKGLKYLWKGFLAYYTRQVIHTVVTYVLLDALIDMYINLKEPVPKKK